VIACRRADVRQPRQDERAIDDHHEVGRQIGTSIGQRYHVAPRVRGFDLVEGVAVDGVLERREVIEQYADAVDIARRRLRRAREHLGRQV
jgi:hypothetical protein